MIKYELQTFAVFGGFFIYNIIYRRHSRT